MKAPERIGTDPRNATQARRLRVAQVVEATLAGVGRHAIDVAEGLAESGHEVHLVYSPRRVDALFASRLAKLPSSVRRLAVPMMRAPGASDVTAIRAVRAYLRREGPFDIVHGHSSKGGLIARMSVIGTPARAVYTPNAISTMNPETGLAAKLVFGAAERFLEQLSAAIIAVSPEEHEHLISIGMNGRRLHVVPNCIRLGQSFPRSEARRELGIPANAIVVGFVGRLERQKAPDILLRAFAQVRAVNPGALLALVGVGSMQGSLKELAASLALGDSVLWLGEREGVRAMPAFDVFALPSRYEGLPYVLLEALATGLPVVTTLAAGARLLVRPGENGELVPPDDVDALGKASTRILAEGELRRQMGEVALELAKQFDLPSMIRNIERVYELAVGAPEAK